MTEIVHSGTTPLPPYFSGVRGLVNPDLSPQVERPPRQPLHLVMLMAAGRQKKCATTTHKDDTRKRGIIFYDRDLGKYFSGEVFSFSKTVWMKIRLLISFSFHLFPPAYQSFLLPDCLSVFLYVSVSVSLPVVSSVCLTVCPYVCLSLCLSFYPSDCLCFCLSVLLSDCLSVCLSLTCPPAFSGQPLVLIVSLFTVQDTSTCLFAYLSFRQPDWQPTCHPFANLPNSSYIAMLFVCV
jgi:hypothetical protein